MLKLSGGIAARGYPLDLVLADAVGPYLAEVPKAVRIVNLNARRLFASLWPLIRYLRREQPAAMLSALNANLIAVWARQLSGVSTRVVVTERNTLSSRVLHYSSVLRMRLLPRLINRFYPWADGIVAVSAGAADDLSRVAGVPRRRIQVIYNPIITPDLQAKTQVPLDHPWFRPGSPPVILAVGSLTAQKDFPTLIKAFVIARKNRQARLMILGEGEERPKLEGLIRELGVESDVSLPGFIVNPYPYMCGASLFVLSSRWEGLPGVLIEALYCGTPLISTDCHSGPREILANGEYGKLLPVGDVDHLARAIIDTLNDGTRRPSPETWSRFELDVVVDQYIKALLGAHCREKTDPYGGGHCQKREQARTGC